MRRQTIWLGVPVLLVAIAPAACRDQTPTIGGVGGESSYAHLGGGAEGPIVIKRSPPSTGGTSGGPLREICETATGESRASTAGDPVIDDFESGDAEVSGDGRSSYWVSYTDESAGTIYPFGTWLPEATGRAGSAYAMHTSGGGFTVWGSGNGFDFSWNDDGGCVYDASIYDGITFWARGEVTTLDSSSLDPADVDRIKVLLLERDILPSADGGGCDGQHGECYDSHQTRIQVSACWRRYSIAFADLAQGGWGQSGGELNLDQLVSLGFEVAKYTNFDFWLDDLSFYSGDRPGDAEDCSLPALGGGGQGGASPL